ncbi:MAG TPA: histidine--tRNA ligase [Patescibacteria group bacterium]
MPRKKEEPKEELVVSVRKSPKLVRGMRDVLPQDQKYWAYIYNKIDELTGTYQFEKIETPILEETALYVRGIGKKSDIVEKEMFSFVDQGGSNLSLRPEATAGVVRAYINHGMHNLPQPVRLYLTGTFNRHERPQAGRLREFHQFDCEALGDDSPVLDAQVILIGFNLIKELGLPVQVQINSLGCDTCRPEYIEKLSSYYKIHKKKICEDCQKRLTKNPLRLLDCKNEQCQEVKLEAPQIVDWLCADCREHFIKVLEYLDELEVAYHLNPQIVRGLDYYNRTTFEYFLEDEEDTKTALGGGGRYDGLVELLGGPRETPAVGMAIGLERLIAKIRDKNIPVPEKDTPDIFLAQLGEKARKKSLILFEKLRKAGFKVAESFSKDNLKNQLETANKLGVKFTLVLGQKEILDGTILIRDMEGGIQEVVDYNKIEHEINKRLSKV